LRRKRIGQQRKSRWRERCLTDAYADTRDKKLRKPVGKPTASGCDTPKGDTPRDNRSSAVTIGQHRDRDAHQRVEQCECETVQHPDLGVGETEVRFDGFDQ